MSEGEFNQQLVDIALDIITSARFDRAVAALEFWEYIITFDQEISTVWRRSNRVTLASGLLLWVRWCMVLSGIFSLVPSLSCKSSVLVSQILGLMGVAQTALFSALRVSAIWDRNYYLLAAVLLLGLAPVATNIFATSRFVYEVFDGPVMLCTAVPTISSELSFALTLTTRLSLILVDSIVLVLTWIKTFTQIRHARHLHMSLPLSTCLTRDGTIYFVGLFGINLTRILLGTPNAKGVVINVLVQSLPPVLINRFMLNLRQAVDPNSAGTESQVPSRMSEISFRFDDNIFGNLGEPLDGDFPDNQGAEGHDETDRRRVAREAGDIERASLDENETTGQPICCIASRRSLEAAAVDAAVAPIRQEACAPHVPKTIIMYP